MANPSITEPTRHANGLERRMLNVIEQQNARIRQLSHQAHRDELTRLNNYNFWAETLETIQFTDTAAVMLVSIDVNLLKPSNDVFGHETGDRALINTSLVLKNTFRDDDVIVRKGGDEFAVALLFDPEELKKEYQAFIDSEQPEIPPTIEQFFESKISNRLQQNINEFNEKLQPEDIPLSISFGAALSFPQINSYPPHNLNETFGLADRRMYHMKQDIKEVSKKSLLLK